jgi:hypothetical protein
MGDQTEHPGDLTREQHLAVQRVLAMRPVRFTPRRLWHELPMRFSFLLIPFATILVLSLLSLTGVRMPVSTSTAALVSSFIGLMLSISESRFTRARVTRLLTPHRGFVCLHCHYPLASLEPAGMCPECATYYNIDEVAAAWVSAYQLHGRVSFGHRKQQPI